MQNVTIASITHTLFSHGFVPHVAQLNIAAAGQAESMFLVRTGQVWDVKMGYIVRQGRVDGLLMPWFDVVMVRPSSSKAENDAVYAQQILSQDLNTTVVRHGALVRIFHPTEDQQPH